MLKLVIAECSSHGSLILSRVDEPLCAPADQLVLVDRTGTIFLRMLYLARPVHMAMEY